MTYLYTKRTFAFSRQEARAKIRESRQQPQRGKGRQCRDVERSCGPVCMYFRDRGGEVDHSLAHAIGQPRAGAAEAKPPRRPLKERGAEFRFQRLDALTDRALRDAELACGFGETQPAGGNFECAQRVKRWQTARRGSDLDFRSRRRLAMRGVRSLHA